MGAVTALAGFILGVLSFILSLRGWDLNRLWLYQLGSASLILVGLQLIISWVVMRVLEELSEREARAAQDMNGQVY